MAPPRTPAELWVSTGATVLNGTLTGSLTINPSATFQNANNGYAVAAARRCPMPAPSLGR